MKSKTLPAWARLVCTAAAALVFLLVYEWAVYGVPLGKIYLPASAWSDEVYYAKQLSAVVTHGVPQGYFGFNESHAEIGRFAAWGPAVFYLYAIPGLIFRGQNAFLYCNLFWVLAGWLCFVWGTRLDWKRQLLFGVGIAALNAPEAKKPPLIWCAGVDTGAYQAVQCRLRRPRTFAGAVGLSGLYDMGRFLGSAEDDLVLRSSPLAALHKNGICDRNVLSKAEENSLLLCVGQGGYEGDALADTQALAYTLSEVGFPCHLEVWGGDVSHDWYWWGKEFGMFAERLFG